ncbi:hypothetical protein DASC09_033650 [Saccharomycopsis crataegensis]|uniref:Uncharacterized protein n=1 Tax=Saccharomycopsis crataegensis TaxID=43959 RepID=A0AAV5QM48_9ASCO|nr:hypothetical protein DASC09_033650 [Saccharomycopsis crataegensis]
MQFNIALLVLGQFIYLNSVFAVTNKYLNSSENIFGNEFYEEINNAISASNQQSAGYNISSDAVVSSNMVDTNATTNNSSNISSITNLSATGIQEKSALSVVYDIGSFICGFFIVCDVVNTAVGFAVELGEALTSKNKELEQAIEASTKYVSIRSEL